MLPPAAWEAMKVTKERRASTNVFGGELVLKAEEGEVGREGGVELSIIVLHRRDMSTPWFTPVLSAVRTSWILFLYRASASRVAIAAVCTVTDTSNHSLAVYHSCNK